MEEKKVDTREKFRTLLNDIAERDGIKRFNKLVELTGISSTTFTSIKLNRVKEVDIETFRKLNSAFKNRYNVLWFQGDDPYMLMEDYLNSKQSQLPMPDYTSLLNAALAAKDETIASYQQQIELTSLRLNDKETIIENLQSQLKDKDALIDSLRQRITTLEQSLSSKELSNFSFPVGVADRDQTHI